MRKIVAIATLLASAFTASAQQYMKVWQDGDDTRLPLSAPLTFTNEGKTVHIGGKAYQTSAIDSITMVHVVTVAYNGDQVLVDTDKAPGVTYSTVGANVTITNTNTDNELELVLEGNSSNGSLTYNGSYKCRFFLNGLNLTSATGAALDIQCGKRVALTLNPGTDNYLSDAANGTQKAALYCKGHLEVEGSGNLTVSGNCKHAIATKEYLQLKKSTGKVTIAKAASDAIHAGQYFQMNGGNVTIDGNTMADGIQVETITLSDDITPDTSKENNGQVIIKGGTITATIAHQDCKGIKSDKDITISGGTISIKPTAGGSRGIQTDGNLTISEENGTTSITIATSGGKCTLAECKADPHRCMGIKVDGNMTVNAGTLKVTHTSSAARDIKVGGTYKKNGGSVTGTVVN